MLRGVLKVESVALGSHFVHRFSLQEFQWGASQQRDRYQCDLVYLLVAMLHLNMSEERPNSMKCIYFKAKMWFSYTRLCHLGCYQ